MAMHSRVGDVLCVVQAPSVELGEGDDLDSELTPEEAAVTDKSLEESMSLIQMIVDDEM